MWVEGEVRVWVEGGVRVWVEGRVRVWIEGGVSVWVDSGWGKEREREREGQLDGHLVSILVKGLVCHHVLLFCVWVNCLSLLFLSLSHTHISSRYEKKVTSLCIRQHCSTNL